MKRTDNFRQIFARERFAAGENQNAEISAESFGDFFDFVRFHLQFFARTIIEFFRKKTMCAAHIANWRN